jgi:hypothetical protein
MRLHLRPWFPSNASGVMTFLSRFRGGVSAQFGFVICCCFDHRMLKCPYVSVSCSITDVSASKCWCCTLAIVCVSGSTRAVLWRSVHDGDSAGVCGVRGAPSGTSSTRDEAGHPHAASGTGTRLGGDGGTDVGVQFAFHLLSLCLEEFIHVILPRQSAVVVLVHGSCARA